MGNENIIHYATQAEIDKQKWDYCIDNSSNGLIYAYSFYLDQMSKHWDALVLNDYEAVMPLTWNKKYGIYYLYQPFGCAQLGLFGNNLNPELLNNFLHAVPLKFKYWEFSLNNANVFPLQDYDLNLRKNFILSLNKSYDELHQGYRENLRRNITKSNQLGCVVKTNVEVEVVIELAKEQMQVYSNPVSIDFENFRNLYLYLQQRQHAITYAVFSPSDELLASCVFFFSHNRAYYILVGNHPNGKTIGASHFLIDIFIKDHAGKNLYLDFEGSDIRSLAFFYSSYGAKEETYTSIKLNKLPQFVKWIK